MFKTTCRGLLERFSQANLTPDFLHKVIITFSTRILLLIIGVASIVVIARILGPEGRGLHALAMTLIGIGIQFGTLGLHASNTYYIAQDASQLPVLLGNSLLLSVVAGLVAALLALGITAVWPELLPFNNTLLFLILCGFPIALAYVLIQALLVGVHEIQFYNIVELLNKILALLFIGVCILINIVTVSNVFIAGVLALFIAVIMSLFQLKKHAKRLPKCSFRFFQHNLGFGFKAYLAAFFSFMVLKSDLWMVQYLLGTEQVGYYSIATAMIDMLYIFPVVVGSLLFPKLSAEQDVNEKWKQTKLIAILVAITMSFIALLLLPAIEPVVRMLFGSEFLHSVQAFLWLLPGVIFLSINTIFMNYFASMGMPSIAIFSPICAFFLNVILNIYLIPNYGIEGAAISSSIAYAFMLVLSLVYIKLVDSENIRFKSK